jgi:hypothetical protein
LLPPVAILQESLISAGPNFGGQAKVASDQDDVNIFSYCERYQLLETGSDLLALSRAFVAEAKELNAKMNISSMEQFEHGVRPSL